jgi:hypothetical protein
MRFLKLGLYSKFQFLIPILRLHIMTIRLFVALIFSFAVAIVLPSLLHAQDTVVVQTLTYDSVGRAGVYDFPDTGSFEKVIMQYSMRCHNGLVSNSTNTEQGCGQWDYNCETYIIDSARTDSVKLNDSGSYQKWPQKFEIMSFVTPYGINLDMNGKSGRMWEFDVTDYLPIMKGWKRLSMERGSGQEDFDIKFLFIRGTPARNVLDIQQIWPMTEENYQTIQSDARYEPREVYLNPLAKGFKLRSYITGHGQQGEFTPETHYLSVNGKKYERVVWKTCSDNPVYPQGGTWTYNRAGWCPGAATELGEFELTGTIIPGDSVNMDYGVEGGSGDSRYDPSNQLVSYGPPNFTLDAAIIDIERPSARIAYARINPACDLPIVVIRNNGSQPLTSLRMEYYVDGGPHQTYNWTGSLAFLDTEALALPIDSLAFWTTATSGSFHVDISLPNGGTDQYEPNNHYSSLFSKPPSYTGIVVVNLATNNNPDDNYYEVRDMSGNTIFSNGGFDPTTSYYDSLILPIGCYTLLFHDDGEDGLSYWANTSQGNGSLRIRQTSKTGKILKTFNADFGKIIEYDFSIVQSSLGVQNAAVPYERLTLYPNPAVKEMKVEFEGFPHGMITLTIVDESGRSLHSEQRFTDALGNLKASLDLQSLSKGSYFLRIADGTSQTERPFVVE